MKKSSLRISDTVCKISNNKVPIEICNNDIFDIKLNKGTNIGHIKNLKKSYKILDEIEHKENKIIPKLPDTLSNDEKKILNDLLINNTDIFA